MFRFETKTRYSETAQDGIIHHSSYVIYFELARIEFFKSFGCDISVLEKNKIFCPVIDLYIKYLKPLLSFDTICVEVSLKEFSKVLFKLEYNIYKENLLVATGSTSHCFTNEQFKPIGIPSDLREKFKQL